MMNSVISYYIRAVMIHRCYMYLNDFKLPSLETIQKIKRLRLFHKAFHHQIAINIQDYIQ